jgi:nudix-type nucleoside diphosphatase (YffH/AdpP family)
MSDRMKILQRQELSRRWARNTMYEIDYRFRDGHREILHREVHDHGSGAAVLPYDPARHTVLLVRQFRLPVHLSGRDGDTLEVCAGLLDGNDPETCASREAEEELGYRLSNLRQVAQTFMTPGAVTEELTLFLAEYGLSSRISDGGGHAAEHEDIEVIEMTFTDLLAMVRDQRIIDAKTVMLTLFLERALRTL